MTDPSKTEEFNTLVPINRPVGISGFCCQNFLMSREMVHRRPLSVWKKLYEVIALQSVCHIGESDYPNLYTKKKIGPEENLEHGRHTQGKILARYKTSFVNHIISYLLRTFFFYFSRIFNLHTWSRDYIFCQ